MSEATRSEQQNDFMIYLDLQGSPDMITKSEMLQFVRECGEKISDRSLTYYTSQGLVPRSVRIGSRAGAYPVIVRELVLWICHERRRGLPIEGIRELIPLWQLLMRGRRERCLDLAEIEYVARETVISLEANYAIPYLFTDVVSGLCSDCLGQIEWYLKDGALHDGDVEQLRLTFVLGELDANTGRAQQRAWTQLTIDGMAEPDLDDPRTLILGIPNGTALIVPTCDAEHVSGDHQSELASAATR